MKLLFYFICWINFLLGWHGLCLHYLLHTERPDLHSQTVMKNHADLRGFALEQLYFNPTRTCWKKLVANQQTKYFWIYILKVSAKSFKLVLTFSSTRRKTPKNLTCSWDTSMLLKFDFLLVVVSDEILADASWGFLTSYSNPYILLCVWFLPKGFSYQMNSERIKKVLLYLSLYLCQRKENVHCQCLSFLVLTLLCDYEISCDTYTCLSHKKLRKRRQ